MRMDEVLEDGCQYDAPGSLIVWLCKKSEANAMMMPGNRWDIGDIKLYEEGKRLYLCL